MDSSGQHVLIAANPKSGATSSAARVADLNQALLAVGYHSRIVTSLDSVAELTCQLHSQGVLRAVVAAGGDGTVAVLANRLPDQVPILVYPLGTENLLAKHLGLTHDVHRAREALRGGGHTRLDVGRANGQLFLVMLSCGFDAEVVRQMTLRRTGHINRWSYTGPILSALRQYRFPLLELQFGPPDEPSSPHFSAAWLFLFNVPRYAAALDFCPQADPTDGELDACCFQRPGVAYGIGYLGRLWLGSHQRMRGFRHRRCQRLRIEAPRDKRGRVLEDVPYQLDGDLGGVLPLDVDVQPRRLTLVIPEDAR